MWPYFNVFAATAMPALATSTSIVINRPTDSANAPICSTALVMQLPPTSHVSKVYYVIICGFVNL